MIDRDTWETPSWLFRRLDRQYKFTFDCCANKNNSKCDDYSESFEDVLLGKNAVAWMNPPFSKAGKMFRHFFNVVPKGVAIYRCDNFETDVWQKIIFPSMTWLFIPTFRIKYHGLIGSSPRFGSAIIGFNLPRPKFVGDGILLIKEV